MGARHKAAQALRSMRSMRLPAGLDLSVIVAFKRMQLILKVVNSSLPLLQYVTPVHSRNGGLSCSSKQTDVVPKFSMFCDLNTPLHIIILFCL
jgi:hypothetical protein